MTPDRPLIEPIIIRYGNHSRVEFDLSILRTISESPKFSTSWLEPTLTVPVPDVWRYTVEVTRPNEQLQVRLLNWIKKKCFQESIFDDSCADLAIQAELPIILLLLESPHKEEYSPGPPGSLLVARGPAQGETGEGIRELVCRVLEMALNEIPLKPDQYALVIANPVQYHCSLGYLSDKGSLNKEVRNHVWRSLWNQSFVKGDFEERLKRYKPILVINACTSTFQELVTEFLWEYNFALKICEIDHPVTWRRKKNKEWSITNREYTTSKGDKILIKEIKFKK